jgi:hypothetical protein
VTMALYLAGDDLPAPTPAPAPAPPMVVMGPDLVAEPHYAAMTTAIAISIAISRPISAARVTLSRTGRWDRGRRSGSRGRRGGPRSRRRLPRATAPAPVVMRAVSRRRRAHGD